MDHIAVSYTADEKVTGILINGEDPDRYLQMLSLPLAGYQKNGALTVRRLRWQWKNNSVIMQGLERNFV